MTRYSTDLETGIQVLQTQSWGRTWSQIMTIVLGINLLLIFFNLTYLPLRSLYLAYVPAVVKIYDPVKGIEPHPLTQSYLQTIDQARSKIAQADLQTPELSSLLQKLREESIALDRANTFQGDDQAAISARLRHRIRRETGASSAQVGLHSIWQLAYLNNKSWSQVDKFLRSQVEPLLQQNYYQELLPTGQPINNFWQLDLYFMVFFGGELLIRTFLLSRYFPDASWGDILIRRWYEIPLLLPFWRWLRLVPTVVRLHRSQLINVEKLASQVVHEPAAYLSDRAAKFIIVHLISEAQAFVKDGRFFEIWQRHPNYTTIGEPEKVDQITDRLVQLIVMRAMPSVKPDIKQLLHHSLQRALTESDVFTGLSQLPGLSVLPDEALKGIAEYLAEATCDVLTSSYTDPEGRLILDQLSSDFRHALGRELRNKADSEELQSLVNDLLEEFKVNYGLRSSKLVSETPI